MGSFGFGVSVFVIPIMVTDWRIGVLVMTLLAELQLLPCAFHSFRITITISLCHITIICSGFAAPQPIFVSKFLELSPFFLTLTGANIGPVRKLDCKLYHLQNQNFLGIPILYYSQVPIKQVGPNKQVGWLF